MPRDRLLHYEIIEVLGQGGMGIVYKARDTRLNRLVALKVFPPDRVSGADQRQRFMQEAQAASALNHPHIVTIYDVGQADDDWFIAMEYVPGRPLASLMGQKGLPLRDAVRYAIQIADALACAHAAGIVHRDLKPGNVMVTPDGATKLVDFGLAKIEEAPAWSEHETGAIAHHTREGAVLGTAAYMSPEQAEGRTVDARSDIFSFGAMLYEMATGRRAFRGESAISTLSAVLTADPQPLTGHVPRDFERIITRCLRKDPAKRFQSMADVRVVLEDVEEDVRPRSRRTVLPDSRRLMWGVAMVLLGAVAAAGGWLLIGRSPGPGPPVTVTPLATYPGVKDFPAISPDGNAVAFSWRKPGTDNFDLYVLQVGGGPPVQRTTSPEDEYFASWSPDGHTIAFVRGSAFGANQIITIPSLGGREQRVASWGGAFFGPAWTADGTHLIVNDRTDEGRPLSLVSISLDTGEKRPFVTLPEGFTGIGDVAGVFSPDRRTLLIYRLFANVSGDLFVQSLSAEGVPRGAPSQLTKQNLWVNGLGFTPDGESVLFSGVREHVQALWRLSVSATGRPERVAFADQAAAFDVAYPAGRLVFERRSPDSNVMRLDVETRTATPLQFLNSTREDLWPAYSADGKQIALVSSRTGQVEIWVCDSTGGDPVQLTRNRGGLEGPRWSPDGSSLALVSQTGSRWSPVIVSAERGQVKRLATGAESSDESVPGWSRNGRWIYFSSNRSGSTEVWKIPATGGQAVQVTRHGGFSAQEAPDGTFLYYTKRWDYPGPSSQNEIWRVPVEGGDETLIVPGIKSYRTFAVGRRGVYYASRASGHDSISVHDFATGHSRLLLELSRPIAAGLSLSPDERYLLYSQTDDEGSELMLADNFR